MSEFDFLHNQGNFDDLVGSLSMSLDIDDILIEKDYWIMHVLWSLQQLGFSFHLKGGTSLSKGYKCIRRFSEDSVSRRHNYKEVVAAMLHPR